MDPLEAVGVAVGGVDEVELAGFLLVIVRVDNASHLHLQRLCEVSPKSLARRLSTYRPVELLHRRRARLLGGEVHRRWDRRALIGVRVVDLEALDRLEFSQIAVSFDRFLHGHSSHSATGPLAVRFQRVVWRVVVRHRLVERRREGNLFLHFFLQRKENCLDVAMKTRRVDSRWVVAAAGPFSSAVTRWQSS